MEIDKKRWSKLAGIKEDDDEKNPADQDQQPDEAGDDSIPDIGEPGGPGSEPPGIQSPSTIGGPSTPKEPGGPQKGVAQTPNPVGDPITPEPPSTATELPPAVAAKLEPTAANTEPEPEQPVTPIEPAPTPEQPAGPITRDDAKQLIRNTKGKFFTVTFIKKDGTTRVMNARLGVKAYLKGGELPYNPNDYNLIPVYDVKKGDYRMINASTITHLKIGNKDFNVEENVTEASRMQKLANIK